MLHSPLYILRVKFEKKNDLVTPHLAPVCVADGRCSTGAMLQVMHAITWHAETWRADAHRLPAMFVTPLRVDGYKEIYEKIKKKN